MIQTVIGTPSALSKPIESSSDEVIEVVCPSETRYVIPW